MRGSKKDKPRPAVESGGAQRNDGTALIVPKDRGEVKLELMPPDFPLQKALLESYMDDWKHDAKHGRDKQNRKYFYFTDVDKCPRRVFYDFRGGEEKRDMKPETMMMFHFGDLFHDEIQTRLRRMGATTNKHVEFGMWEKKGLPFDKSGRVDVLLELPELPSGTLVIGDIKSKDEFSINATPHDEEVDQLMSYIDAARVDPYLTEKQGWKIADFGYLIYVTRREIRFWRVDLSTDRMRVIDEEFRALWAAIEADQLPNRPFARDSVPCQYCRYIEYCWRGVPQPEPPKFVADETIVPPSQEIVESMAQAYVSAKRQMKEAREQLDIAERVLKSHFKSKGVSEMPLADTAIVYELYNDAEVNVEYLAQHLPPELWPSVAKPSITMLREAVKAKVIDGTMFERSLSYTEKDRLKERKAKK